MKYHNTNYLFVALLLCTGPVSGLESDREQPIYIKANKVEIDKQQGYSTYSGNVAITQGTVKIWGDRVTLYYTKGELEKAIIDGQPASFQQQQEKNGTTVVSQAKRMEYYAQQARLFLLDQAKVSQGANSFAGARIEYDVQNSTVIADKSNSSKGRINAILAPAAETQK